MLLLHHFGELFKGDLVHVLVNNIQYYLCTKIFTIVYEILYVCKEKRINDKVNYFQLGWSSSPLHIDIL